MKIQFNSELAYQQRAISSITGIFEGQEICQTNFTVQSWGSQGLQFENDLGYGNRLQLVDEEILENVKRIQLHNGLKQSTKLASRDFTVEMETGTGKTYVYLRSLFELNKLYGFTKFIIVVPSIAIKEGVYKSLQITQEHFKSLYDNINYDYFIYDSQNLEQVRSFATNSYMQIMVINIDAFRKSFTDPEKENAANIIHRANDRLSGQKPIEFIRSTNPIVIIDEPQSVDTTAKAKDAITQLNPLCSLRYSATHVDKHNLMYKLDSIDAYEQKLVKQIEVAHVKVQDHHNTAYIKLLKVDNKKSPITASVEIDVAQNGTTKRVPKTVKQGTDLYEISGGRSVYEGFIINDIICNPGEEYIDFTSRNEVIRLHQCIGDVDEDTYKRLQVRKTIEKHLDKELELVPKGIKVLSLFFIDKVANYRGYDADGNKINGKFAQWFETEYAELIKKPKYHSLFEKIDQSAQPHEIHDGYFSIDKQSKSSNPKEKFEIFKDSSGTTAADNDTYNLIMKDKEKLLGFESKLRFIFSHSALKEGWDTPNVFQICTLNETASIMKKRQEIGRGLRICVNQEGERVHGFEVNTLTVMANESYEDFAKGLQKEIEQDENIQFGIVEEHTFANLVVMDSAGNAEYLGIDKSETLWKALKDEGYIDVKGKVQDALRKDLKSGQVKLPDGYEAVATQIITTLRKIAGGLNIKDADDRQKVKLNKQVFLSEEFKALWDKVKYRTTYRVDFDSQDLVDACVKEMQESLIVGKTRFIYQEGKATISRGGVEVEDVKETTHVSCVIDYTLPDIVSYLQNETNLTRKTIVDILIKSGKLEGFKNNPQKFIDKALEIIRQTMHRFIVDGIKYQKIGDEFYYAQELFETEEVHGYLSKNMVDANKAIYEHVVYDSEIERNFVASFEKNSNVKVYTKLPVWFKIETPLGNYNPDWAVLIEEEGSKKLYFIVESKGSLFTFDRRGSENAKIDCGKAHFEAIGNDVHFAVASSYENLMESF